jgi:hypothetical protein
MAYPASLYSPTTLVDSVDYPQAAHVNTPNAELVLIETELGTDPAGSAADVKTRLAISLADNGNARLTDDSQVTISGGVVTVTRNLHRVETESAAATDNLDTIEGHTSGGVLVISCYNAGHEIVIRNAVDNIRCVGGQNINLNAAGDFALLIYSDSAATWRAMYAGKRRKLVTTAASTYTATTADDVVLCDATAGAFSVTLPPVATSNGVQLILTKTDAVANTVTVDGNASETINGATTYALTAQYNSVTIVCNGAAWYIA